MNPRELVAKLVRLGAELAAGALTGSEPNPGYVAKQLVVMGIEAVGPESLRHLLDTEEAARIRAEVDKEMEAKLQSRR